MWNLECIRYNIEDAAACVSQGELCNWSIHKSPGEN